MSKTLGLALGAGGARGVAHIGFLKALEEEGIVPDYIVGSSIGSIIGACYAKGMTADEIDNKVRQITTFSIVDPGIYTLGTLGIMRWTKVRKILSELLEDCNFNDLKIHFGCVAVDVVSGKLQFFTQGNVTDAVLASSSVPLLFRPVEKDDMILVDGSVLCRVPVKQVKKMGADVVLAVDLLGSSSTSDKPSGMISLTTRVFEIMDSNNTQIQKSKLRCNYDIWIDLDMGDVSQYRVKYNQQAYDAGYNACKENIDKIKMLLAEEK